MTDYQGIYGKSDKLHLPRSPRTYFDSLCSEYCRYPIEQKLVDIGYLTTHGYDIRKDIYHSFRDYPHVHEDDVHRAVLSLEAAACGVDPYDSGIMDRENDIDTDINIMLEEIMARYRYPVSRSGYSDSHYMAESLSEMHCIELDALNGWRYPYLSNITGAFPLYFKDGIMTYQGDESLILRYNTGSKSKRSRIITEVRPEPWYGDILSAKVIILGNMPTYDDFICRSQNLALDIRFRELITTTLNKWHNLWGGKHAYCHLYGRSEPTGIPSVELMDLYFSPTYRHWINSLRNLSKENDIDECLIFKNVAIINAFPYYNDTNRAKPLDLGVLPSHYFIRQLTRYIHLNHPDTIFIIPMNNLVDTWKSILGDMYYEILPQLFISPTANHSLSLTTRALEKEAVEAIIKQLNS